MEKHLKFCTSGRFHEMPKKEQDELRDHVAKVLQQAKEMTNGLG